MIQLLLQESLLAKILCLNDSSDELVFRRQEMPRAVGGLSPNLKLSNSLAGALSKMGEAATVIWVKT